MDYGNVKSKVCFTSRVFFLLLQLINDVKLDKAGNISKLNSHIAKVNTEVFEYYYINVREY